MSKLSTYLNDKYVANGLLTARGEKTTGDAFDPYIYPQEGHVPQCTQCQHDFDAFKRKPMNAAQVFVEFEHSHACLWYDYFMREVRTMCPKVVLRRAHQTTKPVKK